MHENLSSYLDEQRVAVEPDRPAAFGDGRSVRVSRRDINDDDAAVGPVPLKADDPAAVRRPGPAGFESRPRMCRSSVPSMLATKRIAPGPPISLPIMVTSEPSGDSEPFAASAMPPRPLPNSTLTSPPATGSVLTTG